MMYLIAQTWLFLLIAWLIGMAVGFGLSRDQKSQRLRDTEDQLRDARNRGIDMEKELEDFRARVGELEGLPQGVRASRVAARDEMVARIATLERELESSRNAEKRLGDEAERLRNDVDGFRTRYLEARAKWDEYQAKAEAFAAAPAPLNLAEAQVMPDDGMRMRVVELERLLAEATRLRERAAGEAKAMAARVSELEAKGGGKGPVRVDEQANALKERIASLEAQLAAADSGKGEGEQTKLLRARVADLEGRLAGGFSAARETDALKSRIADLQDKLSEAEVALRKAIVAPKGDGEPLRTRIAELEAQLAAASTGTLQAIDDGASIALKAQLSKTEAKLAEAQRGEEELRRLRARTGELEKALERARAQASTLEARLASADGSAASGEDVSLLKARLADVEARLMTSSGASMEFESLRNRVMSLEALLHEAAKSRDEAAILRSKVAELDGRLGQAMKAAAETRPRAAESETA
jgi:predicted  nucleic acid-binding Zn-ribbon protein